jgi:hypothetical protein
MSDPRFGKYISKKTGYWFWQDETLRNGRRRGALGTKNEAEADRLVRDLNEA